MKKIPKMRQNEIRRKCLAVCFCNRIRKIHKGDRNGEKLTFPTQPEYKTLRAGRKWMENFYTNKEQNE